MTRREVLRDGRKDKFWRRMIRRQELSGSTVREFCRTHQLREPSFYYWKRTLAQREGNEAIRVVSPSYRQGRRRTRLVTGSPARLNAPSLAESFHPQIGAVSAASANGPAHRPRGPWLPVAVRQDATQDSGAAVRLEIALPRGVAIRVSAPFEASALAEVGAVLRGLAAAEASRC
jgi:transposase-like protein